MRLATIAFVALTACAGSSTSSSTSSTPASGGANRVVQIACGDFHSCALTSSGKVWCWGRDKNGELGDQGAAGASHGTPMQVPALDGVEGIALGASFGCARVRGGFVRCWGSGKIAGDTSTVEKAPPTSVRNVSDVDDLRAGGYVACVHTKGSAARCWGIEAVMKGAPEKDVAEVAAASSHACARMADGSARCWGEAPWSTTFANPGVTGARAISTGDSFACVAIDKASPSCWGRNDQGELGANPDEDNHAKPVSVRDVRGDVVRLSSAESESCAVLADGSVQCWGDNSDGELGRGEQSIQELAGPVKGLAPASEVAVGADHVCALARDGSVWCWGTNRNGQIGDGTTEWRGTPVRVTIPL